jgi:hypothetical protein
MNFLGIFGIISGALLSIWATIKYLITQRVRLDDNLSKSLMPMIKNLKRKFVINNEISLNKKYPSNFSSFAIINGLPIYFIRAERLLTAGWQSKELISEVVFFRWHRKKIERFLKEDLKNDLKVDVMALSPWGSDKLGEIIKTDENKVYIDNNQYEDIETDLIKMLGLDTGKTSALLYGKPGTGKTRLIKYFSLKYDLPIYSIFLNPNYTNLDILCMFADIPERCIVLLEDFDNYFNNRECIMPNKEIKFTFDSILNGLDGVYNDYKNVFFVMTCNDIDKIDVSLKERPSRFKFVREITGPSYAKRLEILDGNIELAELTEGMTTDRVFFAKSISDKYENSEIIEKINA